jgi:hypothetical protein
MRRPHAFIIAAAGLALLAAACGGSPGGGTTSRSLTSQALAFARCMRAHGVPGFPDPRSDGVFPKPAIYELAAANPRFQPSTRACGHLLPDGGPGVPPSPTVVQQIQTDMVLFARCMHSHGVATWPAPTLDRGREVFDPQAVGIDPASPRISTRVRECEHVFPARIGIPPGA